MENALGMLAERGVIEQISDEPALKHSLSHEMVTLYAGFDPTADSLHLGHLFPLLCLARLQRLGHRPVSLVGGATAMIGDPSGKEEERQLLAEETIEANVSSLRKQLERFLDFDGKNAAIMVNNAEWTKKYSYLEWLRDIGKYFSVNYMLNKESVRRRIEDRSQGISYTEFSYMLLQANDFLELYDRHGCTLQVGGNDQWGNITAGIDLIQKRRHKQTYGITFPLLTSSTGEKFGKTAGNAVWLDPDKTSPYNLYQYWIRTDDRDVIRFLKYFTFLSIEEIAGLEETVLNAPEKREAQRILAEESTGMIHGREGLEKAQKASRVLFGGEINDFTDRELSDIFSDVPSSTVSSSELEKGIGILNLFTGAGVTKSNSQALQLIKQGGIYINNKRIDNQRLMVTKQYLASDSMIVLRGGKKRYHLLKVI
ncbi:MAG: tyrosine--tRNA ligase [Candidatus Latescibacteria bacterium]|nr:tyrosine--tRNA ligase [Candidatus Latescibacterota bacterium]